MRERHQELVLGAVRFLRHAIRILGAAALFLGLQTRLALFEQRAPRLLRFLAVGDVARHFREAAQLAAAIEDGGDDDVRPEARAVFAQAPSFVFDAPLLARDLQLALRLAIRLVFLGVETREVAADDLLRLVAFDPLARPRSRWRCCRPDRA